MKKQLNELFILNDYDTGEAMNYYLTNDASDCYDTLQEIDNIHSEDDELSSDIVAEIGEEKAKEIIALKMDDGWETAFETLCKYRGIKIKSFKDIEIYDY